MNIQFLNAKARKKQRAVPARLSHIVGPHHSNGGDFIRETIERNRQEV
jgi:hypothetical protein